MKTLNKKHKIISISIVIVAVLIIAIIITNKVTLKTALKNNAYNATSGNSSSSLIAEYIKEGVTLGGIEGTFKGIDTSDATAQAKDIMLGKTAYVNGEKITGTKNPTLMEMDLSIGDYIDYTPTKASGYKVSARCSGYPDDKTYSQVTGLKWQVLTVDTANNKVDITITRDDVSSLPRVFFRGPGWL